MIDIYKLHFFKNRKFLLFYIICVWNVNNNVTSKLRMHGAEEVNAKGTELLD